MPKYLGPTFTAAGSGKEKEKPRKNLETVSEQVQGVAQRQGIIVHHCLRRIVYSQSKMIRKFKLSI